MLSTVPTHHVSRTYLLKIMRQRFIIDDEILFYSIALSHLSELSTQTKNMKVSIFEKHKLQF